jgi:hypothetical protein
MKKKKITLVAICTLFAFQLGAQTKIKVSDVSIHSGSLTNTSVTVTGSNVNLLSLAREQGSSLLTNVDLSTYKKYTGSNGTTSNLFSILLGTEFKFRNKMKMNLRGGFTALNKADMSVSYIKEDVYRIDTFTSSQTGQQIFIDSTRTDEYNFSTVSSQLAFDLSATFSTNKLNKFSFYAGLGTFFGFTYASYLDILHTNQITNNNGFNDPIRYQNINQSWKSTAENEKLKIDNVGSIAAIYIPLGIEYRVSKKVNVLKNFSIYTEIRPSLVVSKNSFSETNSSSYWMNIVGLRYHIF